MKAINGPMQTRRLLVFLLPLGVAFVALLLILEGLGTPLPTPAPPTPTPDPVREVVARVGEKRITLADWAVAFYLDGLMSRLSGQPAPAADETLERLVDDALVLAAAAAEEGMAASETDVEVRITLLEATWGLTGEQVAAELTAIGLSREIWADTIARLLTVERYLNEVVWDDVPVEERERALGQWLQAHRDQTLVEVDARGRQPSPSTLSHLSSTAIPVATVTSRPTATPLAVSPLARPSPTPLAAQISPLPTPAVSALATPLTEQNQELETVTVEPPAVGQPAPGFTLADTGGQPVSLGDYRDQRRVVIVFFRTSG